jgi:hypothetical protein
MGQCVQNRAALNGRPDLRSSETLCSFLPMVTIDEHTAPSFFVHQDGAAGINRGHVASYAAVTAGLVGLVRFESRDLDLPTGDPISRHVADDRAT